MTDTVLPRPTPFPWKIGLALLWDAIWQNPRSFRCDALESVKTITPPPRILQPQNIPSSVPALLVMNHYSSSGFGAWWIALGISAQIQEEVHWMMTSGWNHAGIINPLTRWLFPRVAHVYGFTVTPSMPPNPMETDARAKAVRDVVRIAKETKKIIAVAPEGRDCPGGILGSPPAGVGRFLYQLSKFRERIYPIGVYEVENVLCFHFGSPFSLDILVPSNPVERDHIVSRIIMEAIAVLLPTEMRGDYA